MALQNKKGDIFLQMAESFINFVFQSTFYLK